MGVHTTWHDRFVSWPPKIGDPLPGADQVWYEPAKLEDWILGEEGHGKEWRRVFRVGLEERERVWHAIALAVQNARITAVRDRGSKGIVCSVKVELTVGERTAPVTISWHYASEEAAPRLVTAYITL
jgi:hypothetical protein